MTRIRHIALATDDPEETARFYIEGLGMKQIGEIRSPTDDGYYLTDGYITMAILKFKQGVGRLIRTKNDRGTVVILDPRVVRKSYGRQFLSVLPECEIVRQPAKRSDQSAAGKRG